MDDKQNYYRSVWLEISAIAVPLIITLILSIPLFDWVIDDAGISFVYARNLADGAGLVSQPGVPPVEGFSNPLWVFLMALFYAIGLFHPFIVPKVLSLLLVGVTFYFIHRIVQKLTATKFIISLIVLLFLSTNASFVIWTCSGLENPLFAVLISVLLYLSLRGSSDEPDSFKSNYVAGVIAAAVALTRPDGIVYATVYPIAIILKSIPFSWKNSAGLFRMCVRYVLSFSAVFGSYILFRVLYFGEFFPNTYFAKGGPDLHIAIDALTLQPTYLSKLHQILQSVFGAKLWILIPVAIVIWLVTMFRNRESRFKEVTVFLVLFFSGFIYLILINDWMGEYRLATPFFFLIHTFLGVASFQAFKLIPSASKYKTYGSLVVVLLVAIISISHHYKRLSKFYDEKPVSFSSIAERFGYTFNNYADSLGIQNGSFLVPDVGGTLYYTKLRIYDLGGLCDPIIARTLVKDRPKFLEYVFEEIKPTFIHTHGWFTTTARFHEDPRFVRDYWPLHEFEDKFASARLKKKIMSGNYVRREAISSKENQSNKELTAPSGE